MRVRTNLRQYPHVIYGLGLVHYDLGVELVRFPIVIDKSISNLTGGDICQFLSRYWRCIRDRKIFEGYHSS